MESERQRLADKLVSRGVDPAEAKRLAKLWLTPKKKVTKKKAKKKVTKK